MRKNNVIKLMFFLALIILSIFIYVIGEKEKTPNEVLVQETGTETTSEPSETDSMVPQDPEITTQTLVLDNGKELDGLIEPAGQSHLVKDLQDFLEKEDIESTYGTIVGGTAEFRTGVTKFECLFENCTRRVVVAYSDKDDVYVIDFK